MACTGNIDSKNIRWRHATRLLSKQDRYALSIRGRVADVREFRWKSWLQRGPSLNLICFPCVLANNGGVFNGDMRLDNIRRHGRSAQHRSAVAKLLKLPKPKLPKPKLSKQMPPLDDFKVLLRHLKSGGSLNSGIEFMGRIKAARAVHPAVFRIEVASSFQFTLFFNTFGPEVNTNIRRTLAIPNAEVGRNSKQKQNAKSEHIMLKTKR